MEWQNGFTASYYYSVVDATTWRDIERHELVSGTVSKSTESLMESADIEITDLPVGGEVWIRIRVEARQRGSAENEAIFTGLLAVPEINWDGRRKRYKAECYSVLKPAEDVLLPKGWYVPAGLDGAAQAAMLLEDAGPAPVTYDADAPVLSDTIIAESGETNLSMAVKIVNAIGWRIKISGDGSIRICPKSEDPVMNFSAEYNDFLELEVTDTKDWFSCPNVFRATSGDVTATARDDDMNSPYSTASRGREVWKEETNCTLGSNESIEDYAIRRLREEQCPARVCSYARRFSPGVYPGDAITLHYPAQGIDANFRVRSQQITLGHNARTEEECEEIVKERIITI